MKYILLLLLFMSVESQAKVVMSCDGYFGINIRVSTYEEDGLDLYFLESNKSQKQFERVFFGRTDNSKLTVYNDIKSLVVKYTDISEFIVREKKLTIDKVTGEGEYIHTKTNTYFQRTDFLRRNYMSSCYEIN